MRKSHFCILICFGLFFSTVTSCVKFIHDNAVEDYAISFYSEVQSKLPVNSVDDMEEFAVWAYYKDGEGYVDVFDGTKVRKENGGNWVYDGLEMWQFNKTYNFYAVYPAGLDVTCVPSGEEEPYITVNYDAKLNDHDVMLASNEGIMYSDGASPAPVGMSFKHLLSRLEFVGKIDPVASAGLPDFTAEITSAKIYGLYAQGEFSGKDYNPDDPAVVEWAFVSGSQTTAVSPYRTLEDPIYLNEGNLQGESIFGDLLVFPARNIGECVFHIEWTVGGIAYSQDVSLSLMDVKQWVAGRKYRYSFVISDSNRILFDKPTVEAWEDASGGIIIVD